MSQIEATNQSTWRSKIKAMGPGILMASAAVGGVPTSFPQLKRVLLMDGPY